MRVAIASRIFEPEPSAASFRLAAMANAFVDSGHEVVVLTVRPPARLAEKEKSRRYRVHRFPVLRDRSGYVRGYLQYLSFDLPLFFRLLFGRRNDIVVSEPPPTTGFFVRIATALRRTPYVYYAADIWSDASSQTGAPDWVVRAVRRIERFALRGAHAVLSVSEGVTLRLAELGVAENVMTIGNGIDIAAFSPRAAPSHELSERAQSSSEGPIFVYAGTASEWHGAGVFVQALPKVLEQYPHARMLYIGGGSEREAIRARAEHLGVAGSVSFEPVREPMELAPLLCRTTAAIASVRPGAGYDFAFPTKLYSAAACGAPLLYSGIGPAVAFVHTEVAGRPLGWAVGSDADEVAAAMIEAAATPFDAERRAIVAAWAAENVSLDAVAARAVHGVERFAAA